MFIHGQNIDETENVKQVILAFQEDFNNGLFLNAHTYTTNDWVHINPIGVITNSREEVLKDVRSVHQSFLKDVTMKIEKINIRFIAPTVAVAEVIHIMSPYELPEGVLHQNEKQTKSYIVVKVYEKWLLTLDHNTIQSNQPSGNY